MVLWSARGLLTGGVGTLDAVVVAVDALGGEATVLERELELVLAPVAPEVVLSAEDGDLTIAEA